MNKNRTYRLLLAAVTLGLLVACASAPPQPPCSVDQLDIANCPPAQAVADETVASQQDNRRWHSPGELDFDPIQLGMESEIPIHDAQMRIIGSSYENSVRSLATKIWLIDNAEYTIDAAYYIFKQDLVGYSFLGALCDAVKRGVDVRVMVDSLGSINLVHSELKALENCAINGGFVKNTRGEVTTTKARVQVVVFNAFSKVFVNFNRRSHDKLLLIDGAYPEQAWAMTGGRNISLSYYGLHADGSQDPTAFNDMDTAPRLLLGKEYGEQWRDKQLKDNELKSDLVESQQWRGMVNHPRIKIYQTGRLDSVLLGGDTHYGKLHAKFLIGADDIGFVGTSKFDDRSKLYNNEMGYFFESAELIDDLLTEFELLKSQSYLWGSPEWLQMRQQMRATKSAPRGSGPSDSAALSGGFTPRVYIGNSRGPLSTLLDNTLLLLENCRPPHSV